MRTRRATSSSSARFPEALPTVTPEPCAPPRRRRRGRRDLHRRRHPGGPRHAHGAGDAHRDLPRDDQLTMLRHREFGQWLALAVLLAAGRAWPADALQLATEVFQEVAKPDGS